MATSDEAKILEFFRSDFLAERLTSLWPDANGKVAYFVQGMGVLSPGCMLDATVTASDLPMLKQLIGAAVDEYILRKHGLEKHRRRQWLNH